MNSGVFGEGFPYSNFHDLNMDWIIKIAKDFLDQYTNIKNTITTIPNIIIGSNKKDSISSSLSLLIKLINVLLHID